MNELKRGDIHSLDVLVNTYKCLPTKVQATNGLSVVTDGSNNYLLRVIDYEKKMYRVEVKFYSGGCK